MKHIGCFSGGKDDFESGSYCTSCGPDIGQEARHRAAEIEKGQQR
jgi:hypothetical protein